MKPPRCCPYFAELTDLRRTTKAKLQALQDILMRVFCAVLSGVTDAAADRLAVHKTVKKDHGRIEFAATS